MIQLIKFSTALEETAGNARVTLINAVSENCGFAWQLCIRKFLMYLYVSFNQHFSYATVTADQRWKEWPWRRRRGGWDKHNRGGSREKTQSWQWISDPYRAGQERMLRVFVPPRGPLPVKDSVLILRTRWQMSGTEQRETPFIRWCGRKVWNLWMIPLNDRKPEPCCRQRSQRRDFASCCQWQSSIALLPKRTQSLFLYITLVVTCRRSKYETPTAPQTHLFYPPCAFTDQG